MILVITLIVFCFFTDDAKEYTIVHELEQQQQQEETEYEKGKKELQIVIIREE